MADRDYMRHDFDRRPRSQFWATYPLVKGFMIGLTAIHLLLAIVKGADPETYQSIMFFLQLDPEYALKHFYIWQLVTAGLLHAPGIWHLGWNLLFLWWFGRLVEARMRRGQFLLFCVATTVAASLCYLLEAVVMDRVFPMLGASGMVMGLVVLAACWNPHMEILFFFVLRMKLWVLAVVMVVADFLLMLQSPGGVAHAAHLGGALYGWIYFRYGGGVERVFNAIDEMADKQRRKKEEKRAARDAELRKEIDRILDKVNREGMTGLTEEERRFLKQASDKLRR